MNDNITLSPKYGVNPTIPICFFCGNEKNEISLMGYLGKECNKDIKAPKNMLIDYMPCDDCKRRFRNGVLLLEVTKTPNFEKQICIQEDCYPTGRYMVLKPETLKNEYKAGDTILLIQEDYQKIQRCDLTKFIYKKEELSMKI